MKSKKQIRKRNRRIIFILIAIGILAMFIFNYSDISDGFRDGYRDGLKAAQK